VHILISGAEDEAAQAAAKLAGVEKVRITPPTEAYNAVRDLSNQFAATSIASAIQHLAGGLTRNSPSSDVKEET